MNRVQEHYQPTDITLRLVAGITPDNYLWDFTPTAQELSGDPTLTSKLKREKMFKGWTEKGWMRPHLLDGAPDGRYEADMVAAIGHQVEQAGLAAVYQVDIQVKGDIDSGHASNSAGKHGITVEERDYYVVLPSGYQKAKELATTDEKSQSLKHAVDLID